MAVVTCRKIKSAVKYCFLSFVNCSSNLGLTIMAEAENIFRNNFTLYVFKIHHYTCHLLLDNCLHQCLNIKKWLYKSATVIAEYKLPFTHLCSYTWVRQAASPTPVYLPTIRPQELPVCDWTLLHAPSVLWLGLFKNSSLCILSESYMRKKIQCNHCGNRCGGFSEELKRTVVCTITAS